MTITIDTKLGKIRGNRKDGYNEWLGIKYATAGRFEDPEPVTGWEGVYDATEFGPKSMQYKGLFGKDEFPSQAFYSSLAPVTQVDEMYSEDCLNLNVYAPENAEKCPVYIFIHGGGFASGSNSDLTYTFGTYARAGIVNVVINYRLAFYATANIDGFSGNYAIKDQIQALQWVYDNIEAFGGDPERITIGGESAGAYSVQNLLNSPKVKDGIIKGAIMMSGAGNTAPVTLLVEKEVHEKIWTDVRTALGINNLQEIKDMPGKDIYETWAKCASEHTGFVGCPSIDGEYLTGTAKDAVDSGLMKNVPLLLGMLSEDMWPILLYKGIMEIAEARSKEGGAPVYSYFFDYQIDERFGAYHAGDMPFAFGLKSHSRKASQEERKIGTDLFEKFCNFIKYGNPSPEKIQLDGETGKPEESENVHNEAGRWLSMQESQNSFYELNGTAHRMMRPDPEKLMKQTEKGQPFPVL